MYICQDTLKLRSFFVESRKMFKRVGIHLFTIVACRPDRIFVKIISIASFIFTSQIRQKKSFPCLFAFPFWCKLKMSMEWQRKNRRACKYPLKYAEHSTPYIFYGRMHNTNEWCVFPLNEHIMHETLNFGEERGNFITKILCYNTLPEKLMIWHLNARENLLTAQPYCSMSNFLYTKLWIFVASSNWQLQTCERICWRYIFNVFFLVGYRNRTSHFCMSTFEYILFKYSKIKCTCIAISLTDKIQEKEPWCILSLVTLVRHSIKLKIVVFEKYFCIFSTWFVFSFNVVHLFFVFCTFRSWGKYTSMIFHKMSFNDLINSLSVSATLHRLEKVLETFSLFFLFWGIYTF